MNAFHAKIRFAISEKRRNFAAFFCVCGRFASLFAYLRVRDLFPNPKGD